MIGKFVIIRTINAGVHFGTLEEIISEDYKVVRLSNARRLWQWSGALSLSEVAMKGINIDASKIAERVDEIIITQAIEIIPVSSKSNLPGNHEARKNISAKL
jgi:hypothetical protein